MTGNFHRTAQSNGSSLPNAKTDSPAGISAGINRQYKDRLFKFLFGNPEHREWTLSLYNAINGTDYRNPDDITFTTIERLASAFL